MTVRISKYCEDMLPLNDEELPRYKNRAEGKSTGLALNYISQAILNPEMEVKIIDHHGTMDANQHLFNSVMEMCSKLNLTWMEFIRGSLTIRYCPYIYLKSQVKTTWVQE